MRVPILDLAVQYKRIRPEIDRAIAAVAERQQFILGPEVGALEENIASFLGAPFAVGVSSGSDALLIALMALGISPGDEVVTTPFTFFATAGAISRLGARPAFADIEVDSFNIDPEKVKSALTAKTKALLPVHLFGRCARMEPLLKLAAENGLSVVEDAAQAIGARGPLGAAGAMADAGCLSFFPTKNLGAFGDAGMVLVKDEKLYRRLRNLRVHGSQAQYTYEALGGNFRIDTLQAAVLLVKLNYLEEWTARRVERARSYHSLLEEAGLATGPIRVPEIPEKEHVFHQYVVRAEKRDELREFLAGREIQTGVYYPLPLHLQPCFAHLGYSEGDFPESERASREVLALPMYPELERSAQEYVVRAISDFYGG